MAFPKQVVPSNLLAAILGNTSLSLSTEAGATALSLYEVSLHHLMNEAEIGDVKLGEG